MDDAIKRALERASEEDKASVNQLKTEEKIKFEGTIENTPTSAELRLNQGTLEDAEQAGKTAERNDPTKSETPGIDQPTQGDDAIGRALSREADQESAKAGQTLAKSGVEAPAQDKSKDADLEL